MSERLDRNEDGLQESVAPLVLGVVVSAFGRGDIMERLYRPPVCARQAPYSGSCPDMRSFDAVSTKLVPRLALYAGLPEGGGTALLQG